MMGCEGYAQAGADAVPGHVYVPILFVHKELLFFRRRDASAARGQQGAGTVWGSDSRSVNFCSLSGFGSRARSERWTLCLPGPSDLLISIMFSPHLTYVAAGAGQTTPTLFIPCITSMSGLATSTSLNVGLPTITDLNERRKASTSSASRWGIPNSS